jgi:hypothetical protein
MRSNRNSARVRAGVPNPKARADVIIGVSLVPTYMRLLKPR